MVMSADCFGNFSRIRQETSAENGAFMSYGLLIATVTTLRWWTAFDGDVDVTGSLGVNKALRYCIEIEAWSDSSCRGLVAQC